MRWLRTNHRDLVVRLSNVQAFHDQLGAFGSLNRTASAAEALRALSELVLIPTDLELNRLKISLAELAPRPVIAGLYRPGAGGPLAQFRLLLREMGISYHEIAAILGQVGIREEYEREDVYQRTLTARWDAHKHCSNTDKAKLRRVLGDDALLAGSAQLLPGMRRCVVFWSVGVRRHSTATVHL